MISAKDYDFDRDEIEGFVVCKVTFHVHKSVVAFVARQVNGAVMEEVAAGRLG